MSDFDRSAIARKLRMGVPLQENGRDVGDERPGAKGFLCAFKKKMADSEKSAVTGLILHQSPYCLYRIISVEPGVEKPRNVWLK